MNPTERRQVRRLASLGSRELARLWRAGRLDCPSAWLALKAASCFRRSIRDFGLARAGVQQARLATCQACPCASVGKPGRLARVSVVSCGPLGDDRTGEAEPTCGCIVAVVDAGGSWSPAGKTAIERAHEGCSPDCPQGKF